jgi:hypothetical protein
MIRLSDLLPASGHDRKTTHMDGREHRRSGRPVAHFLSPPMIVCAVLRVRRLQVYPPRRDYHVVAYFSIDIVVKTEPGYAVVVGVKGLFGIFAENRPEGVDEWFPDVGPVPARSGRDTDGHTDRSRC